MSITRGTITRVHLDACDFRLNLCFLEMDLSKLVRHISGLDSENCHYLVFICVKERVSIIMLAFKRNFILSPFTSNASFPLNLSILDEGLSNSSPHLLLDNVSLPLFRICFFYTITPFLNKSYETDQSKDRASQTQRGSSLRALPYAPTRPSSCSRARRSSSARSSPYLRGLLPPNSPLPASLVLTYTKTVRAALMTLPAIAKARLMGTGLSRRGPWVSASRAGWTNWPRPETAVMLP